MRGLRYGRLPAVVLAGGIAAVAWALLGFSATAHASPFAVAAAGPPAAKPRVIAALDVAKARDAAVEADATKGPVMAVPARYSDGRDDVIAALLARRASRGGHRIVL